MIKKQYIFEKEIEKYEKKWGKLTPAEKKILLRNPHVLVQLSNNRSDAELYAQENFPKNTLHNGNGDAFRHAYFNALNTRDFGLDFAQLIGDAHEIFAGNPHLEKKMDLYNNKHGRLLGYAYGRGVFRLELAKIVND